MDVKQSEMDSNEQKSIEGPRNGSAIAANEKRPECPAPELATEASSRSNRDERISKTTSDAENGHNEDPKANAPPPPPELYSTFTAFEKRIIVLAASFAAFFSPLTGSIYFPALSTIAQDLDVSSSQINLTVTTYLIFQGISPMFISGFSDNVGRRPPYVICFAIYIIANLALALNNSYGGLVGLRCIQSMGSSGTVALAQGVVADIVTSAERGKYIGYASVATMLGPSLSPVIGGLLAESLDWHWIFFFLLILSCSFGVPFLLFLPETGRKTVDDGSIPPPPLNTNVTDMVRHKRRRERGEAAPAEKVEALRKNYKLSLPNPLPSLLIIFDLESLVILLIQGASAGAFYAISTAASANFRTSYHFNDIQVALMFLPLGVGGIMSALTVGRVVDWNFRRHCKKRGVVVQKGVKIDLSDFPIERARLQVVHPLVFSTSLCVIAYGWMLHAASHGHGVSLAGPIIMLFLLGFLIVATSQCLSTLMVDIWPGQAASAAAANNVVRCGIGAAGTAVIDPMFRALGLGWTYTILAVIGILCAGLGSSLMWWGIGWRKRREERERRRKEAKEENRREKNGREGGHAV